MTTTERILDAAINIVIGDGIDALSYRTIAERLDMEHDDIVAVYPVFERLLGALLIKVMSTITMTVIDNIDRDPRGGLPSRIFGYSIAAIYENAAARALYLGDPVALSRVMRALDGLVILPELSVHPRFLVALQERGMARDDLDPNTVSAVLDVVGAGISLAAPEQQLDAVTAGLITLLERGVDTDVEDTTPGKQLFFQFVEPLVGDAAHR